MEIISRAVGCQKAVEQTVEWDLNRALATKVNRYCCNQVGGRDIAEDQTTTTFERVWHGRMGFGDRLGDFLTG